MNFLFAYGKECDAKGVLRVPRDARVERLAKSIKLQEGARFRVAIEDRGRGTAIVKRVTTRVLQAEVCDCNDCQAGPAINLIMALPRPKVVRRLVPRLASMGIDSLTFVNACGVLKEYFDTHWLAKDQIQELVMLGLEQGGSCRRPAVSIKKRLKPFIEDSLSESQCCARIVFAPQGTGALPDVSDAKEVMLAIGPETGWTDFEGALFEEAGFVSYSMGEEHMPSDVAAIGATAIVKSRMVLS